MKCEKVNCCVSLIEYKIVRYKLQFVQGELQNMVYGERHRVFYQQSSIPTCLLHQDGL